MKTLIIAPTHRLADYAARFVLEVSPRSCILVNLDSRGGVEKMHGLLGLEIDAYYFYAPRLRMTPIMQENYDLMKIIAQAQNINLKPRRLP